LITVTLATLNGPRPIRIPHSPNTGTSGCRSGSGARRSRALRKIPAVICFATVHQLVMQPMGGGVIHVLRLSTIILAAIRSTAKSRVIHASVCSLGARTIVVVPKIPFLATFCQRGIHVEICVIGHVSRLLTIVNAAHVRASPIRVEQRA